MLFVERAVGGITVDCFNPAHVLHLPLATAITWLLHGIGLPAGGMLVLQALAALAGAAAGALLLAMLADETGLPLAAATALAAFLYAGTWFFATDGETNHLGLVFAVASLAPLRTILLGAPRRGTVAAAGVRLAGAPAFHLTLGTPWIALVLATLLMFRARVVPVVASLSLASALLGLAYVPCAVLLSCALPTGGRCT